MANFWDVGTNLNINPSSVGGQILDLNNRAVGSQLTGLPDMSINKLFDSATGGPGPTYHAPSSDPQGDKQMQDQMQGLLKSPEGHMQDIMSGTGKAGQIQNQSQNQANEQNQLGGGGINGMSQAISDKAQKNFSKDQDRLQMQSKFKGQEMANRNALASASLHTALSDAQNNVNSQLNQLQLEANAATYRTAASIMSGAGSLAGVMAAKNRPAPYTNAQLGDTGYGNAPGEVASVYNTNPYNGQNTSQDYSGANFGPGSTNNDYAPFDY